MVGEDTRAPHLVKESQSFEGSVGVGQLSDEGCPSDNVLGHIMGSREQEQALVDEATSGVAVEEVVKEERQGDVGGGDELGVNLSNILKALGLDGGVEKMVEMGGTSGRS